MISQEVIQDRGALAPLEYMETYKVRYKNAKFSGQKIELDEKSFSHCEFENCIIVLDRGETEVTGSTFKNCKLTGC